MPADNGSQCRSSRTLIPLAWLALGSFGVGTEIYMIVGLTPHIAPDFDVPIHQTGILLTVSAAVCAVSAPVIAAVFRRMAKRSVVVCGLCIFCAGNLMAATSSSFMVLVVARAISAVAAAAFSPAAYALASASV
jgi:DHA1 family inner membrane transport protein